MPKLSGVFANLSDIIRIRAEDVKDWSKRREDVRIIDNEIGNRILYPTVVPVSEEDLSLNLAIIREVIELHPEKYFDKLANKILIPENFLSVVPDLSKLALTFIDAFHPYGCTAIFLKNRLGAKNLGTLLKANVLGDGIVGVWIHGEKQFIRTGTIKSLKVEESRVDIKFESEVAELFGRKEIAVEVVGGKVGLIVDARS